MRDLTAAGVSVIPPVVEEDLETERPYYVLPWYEGGSLEQAVEDSRFRENPADGLNSLAQLAQGVAEVHAHGFAHRDLKPSNVLFDPEGQIWLADFGLCLAVEPGERLTATEEAVGSRFYIAPENAAGINQELDQRPADFYAFGKIIWALLAGRQPTAREEALEDPWTLPAMTGNPKLSGLQPLLEKLLDLDPRSRLSSWEIVIEELRAVRDHLEGGSPPSPRVGSRPIDIARRLTRVPAVRKVLREDEADRRRTAWKTELQKTLLDEARVIEPELRARSEAANGVLIVHIGAEGGESYLATDPHSPLSETLHLAPLGGARSVTGGPQVAYHLYSNVASPALPDLKLSLFTQLVDDEYMWLVRIPAMRLTGAMGIPVWLAGQTVKKEGPLRPYLFAAIQAARKAAREANGIFLAMVDRYIEIVASGENPLDPEAWGTPPLDLADDAK